MQAERTAIDGLLVLTSTAVEDERGTVRELYRESAFSGAGLPTGPWAQVNLTYTRHGAIRGLHAEEMVKLVGVASGEAFGAYVDLREASPTYGTVVTASLVPGRQVLVPRGVANGFQALSPEGIQYLYCFDREWAPGMPGRAANALDPALAIAWPVQIDHTDRGLLSAKDAAAPGIDGRPVTLA